MLGVLQTKRKKVLATMQVRHGIYVIPLKSAKSKASASGIDTSFFTNASHSKPNIGRRPTLKAVPETQDPALTMNNTPWLIIKQTVLAFKPRGHTTYKLTHTSPYSDHIFDIPARR